MSHITDFSESVKNYWHNDCIVKKIENNNALVINKTRSKIVYIGGWDWKTNLPNGTGKQYKTIGKCLRDKSFIIENEEYYYGKISHKGNWKQGIYTGFGIHWYMDGKMYWGNWKNNKADGYGRLYDENKKIEQQGTWKDGKIYNGFGKINKSSKLLFIGEIANGHNTQYGKFFNNKGEQIRYY